MSGVSDSLSIQILVLRCQTGDEVAFGRIVERFHKRLSYFVRKMLADSHRVDDVLQNVWFDVFRKIRTLRNPEAFSTWVYRIARDHVYRLHRKRRLPTEPLQEANISAEESALEGFSAEDCGQVHAALDLLSAPHREVLMLRFLDELDYEQIAEIVGCEIGTVKSRLHYAKRALKQILERERVP